MRPFLFLIAILVVALVANTAVAAPADAKSIVPATVTVPACDAVSEHSTCHKVHARAHRPLLRVVAAPVRIVARVFQAIAKVRVVAKERRQSRRAHRRVFGPLCRRR